jgi:molybdenum cofactor cytidylyltransferase
MSRWKPLLPFGETTIIQTVVQVALSVCARVIVVTGYRGAELSAVLEGDPRVTVAENLDWEMGMFSSLQRGVTYIDTERFFITLGDKPFIRQDVYTSLLRAGAADAVFPVFRGERGHPVLLRSAVREAMLAADANTSSMPTLLSRFVVKEIQWHDDSVVRDIDTPQQYSAAGGLQTV